MEDLECPYCGEGQTVNHDDGRGYKEDQYHQMTCSSCKNEFVFTTSIFFSYEPQKADCLNGSEHEYKLQKCSEPALSVMVCKMCGEARNLTNDEHKEFGIETILEFRNRYKQQFGNKVPF